MLIVYVIFWNERALLSLKCRRKGSSNGNILWFTVKSCVLN